jgi:hypothetical protein
LDQRELWLLQRQRSRALTLQACAKGAATIAANGEALNGLIQHADDSFVNTCTLMACKVLDRGYQIIR